MKTLLHAWTLALALLGPILVAPSAVAQTSAEVMTAREIAKRGLAAYDAGDYETAADQFGQAYSVVKVPTVAVYWARALVELGKLVEASEIYQEASMLPLEKGQQKAQEMAQMDARAEREQLLPRIPKLTVVVEGTRSGDVTFLLDGVEVSGVLVRAGYAVNPGQHRVAARLDGHEVTQDVALEEGAEETVTLSFDATPQSAGVPAVPPPTTREEPKDVTTERSNRSWQRPTGIVVTGVGAVVLAVGGISGLRAKNQRDDLLADGCDDDGACFKDQQDDVDGYNRSLRTANVGFVAGGLLVAGGVALILTAPKKHRETRHVVPWVGWHSAGVQGRF